MDNYTDAGEPMTGGVWRPAKTVDHTSITHPVPPVGRTSDHRAFRTSWCGAALEASADFWVGLLLCSARWSLGWIVGPATKGPGCSDQVGSCVRAHECESVPANWVLADPDLATVLAPVAVGVWPQGVRPVTGWKGKEHPNEGVQVGR
jgi:hypothetical protein